MFLRYEENNFDGITGVWAFKIEHMDVPALYLEN